MTDLSPFALAARQIALDHEATAAIPALFERKKQRLLASPHAFLRGSAPLFYEILAARAELASGPDGEGWLVGDAHLENVGAYRGETNEVVFDLNDFDDGAIGPWHLDALRLATSVLLAARGLDLPAPKASALCETLLEAHAAAACRAHGLSAPPRPGSVDRLIEVAKARSKADLLDDRCSQPHKGVRRFERGERYLDLPREIQAAVPDLLREYVTALGERAPKARDWGIEDAAQRVAGTGSLGRVRIAIVVKTASGEDRIVELKEEGSSSVERLLGPPHVALAPSDRVVAAAHAMTPAPARLLASLPTTSLGRSFIGRTLAPQEDKLDMTSARARGEIDAIVRYAGHLLGSAHARAASRPPAAPWSAAELAQILDQAIELGGLFESVYLAYARLVDDRPAWISRHRQG